MRSIRAGIFVVAALAACALPGCRDEAPDAATLKAALASAVGESPAIHCAWQGQLASGDTLAWVGTAGDTDADRAGCLQVMRAAGVVSGADADLELGEGARLTDGGGSVHFPCAHSSLGDVSAIRRDGEKVRAVVALPGGEPLAGKEAIFDGRHPCRGVMPNSATCDVVFAKSGKGWTVESLAGPGCPALGVR